MKIDLFYTEALHDEVPGVIRHLNADEIAAGKQAQELIAKGGRVYQQKLPVELPAAYSHLEMEAALCVWEHLCDITVNTEKPDAAWMEYRESVGSVELRHESIEIGKWALKVFDLLPEWYRASGAYDWEIIPAIVGTLTPGEDYFSPDTAAHILLNDEGARAEYLRSFDWYLKRDYAITVEEGAGLTQDDFFTHWFVPEVEPAGQVERFAEKYGLNRQF